MGGNGQSFCVWVLQKIVSEIQARRSRRDKSQNQKSVQRSLKFKPTLDKNNFFTEIRTK